ncbi:MAG: redoxin domain-containing protein [Elusimicrobia bacterium]|nr:redoxin domain-containing protein [Elusimicrobiota bacterium]
MKKNALLMSLLFIAACSAKPEERPAIAQKEKPAPVLELKKLINSNLKELSDWRDLKGKAVVLEFWASWCEPCVDNIPHINGLAEKFRGKPVVFISVTDESETVVRGFMKEHEMKGWIAPEAPASVFKSFRVYGRPHTVLIDKTSKVAAFTYPSEVTENTIESLLEGKITLHSDAPAVEDSTSAAKPLAEFYIARSAKKSGRASYGPASISASAMPFFFILQHVFKSADKIEPDKETADIAGAHYDVRVSLPLENGKDYKDFFSRGLEDALGLKLTLIKKKAEVYILKKTPGGIKGFAKTGEGTAPNASEEGNVFTVTGFGLDVLCQALKERLDTPVVDETGVNAGYSYGFDFKSGDFKTINAELPVQLGLRLEKGFRKINVLEVRKKMQNVK